MKHETYTMIGKICMVTGGTSGIGLATSLALAREGATVTIVGRDHKRCSDTARKIRRDARNPAVDVIAADLSLQRDIRQCAAEFKQRYQHLDVLINNAGARYHSRLETAEGLEMNFALNHVGTYYLTRLLIHELMASNGGRIINVSSEAHRGCPGINFDDLQGKKEFDGRKAYGQAKLACLLTTYELARRLSRTNVTANALEPGNVISGFARNNGFVSWMRHIVGSLKQGSLSGPKTGASTSIYLATSPDVSGISGRYFSRQRAVRSSDASYDADAAKRLWKISAELTDMSDMLDSG